MTVIFDAPGFCMETVFYCSNFGLHFNDFTFMGKKYVLSLSQVISSCSEGNNLILFDKMFQHISVRLSRLIDRLFTLTLQKHVPTELSLQMMENSEYSNSNLPN